jgi:hypothetical protein
MESYTNEEEIKENTSRQSATVQRITDERLNYLNRYNRLLLQQPNLDPMVRNYIEPAVVRALGIIYSHQQMEVLIPEVMEVLCGSVAEPFSDLMRSYRSAYIKYLEALGKLKKIYDLHSIDLIYAQEEGETVFKGALKTYLKALEDIPDLKAVKVDLQKSIETLSKAIVDLAKNVHAQTKKALEEATKDLRERRELFQAAEQNYNSNRTAGIYFSQHKENREARISFIKKRIDSVNNAIVEQDTKLKAAQAREQKSSSKKESGFLLFGIDLGYTKSRDEEINTDWTQSRCKLRKSELEKEKETLEEQLDNLVKQNETDEVQITKLQESFAKSYNLDKENLIKAEKQYQEIHSKYLAETIVTSGIDHQLMNHMTKILLHLQHFAISAIPNLAFIDETRDGVLNLIRGDENITARRVIPTLKPLADAYIEEEVLLSISARRAYTIELKDFYQRLSNAKARALESDPAIKIGDPVNIDRFAATPSGPQIWPL